ncbi:heme-binding protein [Saccharopolyspora sp. WRP15-2]|uniref:Heme-binding protein n=1 Tax=Saccharopolyspora oryzae TaxID=2997343 RepID=A0ABT4V453_9PSEU|nr:heme-binding protein [Saccharopolyspora oryzae]MDA3628744.1 heme-binding protein [Saccharopolyspora oryzae]
MRSNTRNRAVVGTLVGLGILGGATGLTVAQAAPAPQQAPQPPAAVIQQPVLSVDAATKAAQAALDAAEAKGQRVTVSIVDRAGNERVRLTGDGAGPQSGESAKRKAFTAVAWGKPTAELGKGITGDGPTLRDIPGTLFLGGGVPVTAGSPIAGIGVAGAPSADLDAEFANAGLQAIQAELR